VMIVGSLPGGRTLGVANCLLVSTWGLFTPLTAAVRTDSIHRKP
jgi:hypothetical protein